MANSTNESAEKIKSGIKATSEKSKETIREIINSNSKYLHAALDSNKKVIDSVREKLNQEKLDDTVTGAIKNAFQKSIELSEDALDSIINSYTRQMEFAIDSNSKLLDKVKELNISKPDQLLNTIRENFEASRELNVKNTKEMVDFYNKHTNLALNFNQKFGEGINLQVATMAKLQQDGYKKFTEWASDWWKNSVKETATKSTV
jgi:hypothetical protein